MRKIVIPVLALAVVAALLFWGLGGLADSDHEREPSHPSGDSGSTDPFTPGAAGDADAARDDTTSDTDLRGRAGTGSSTLDLLATDDEDAGVGNATSGDPGPDAATPDVPVPEGHVLIEGTIVVVDEKGNEHPEESGEFRMTFWRGNHGANQQVQVVDGEWSVAAPEDVELGIWQLRLGDRPAALVGTTGRVPIPESGELDLHAYWPRVTIVHVRSAETGQDLTDLIAVRVGDWERREQDHPGDYVEEEVIAESPESPLEIIPDSRTMTDASVSILVHSPGHAWTRLQLDLSRGGERELVLSSGGDLEIELAGAPPPQGAMLRLRRQDANLSRPAVELDLGSQDVFNLPGLRSGHYDITAELGRWFREPRVIGTVTAEVIAGESTSAVLSLEAQQDVPRGALTGDLFVPSEWELERMSVTLKLLDTALDGSDTHSTIRAREMEVEQQAGGSLYRFDAGLVQTGRYEVGMYPLGYSISLEVGEDGAHARLELPAPGTVIVSPVLKDSGDPVHDLDSVHWHYRRPQWVNGGGLETVERDPDTGEFEFQAPLGAIVVRCWGSGFASTQVDVEVVPGVTRAKLPLERSSALRLSFFEGETPVPWSDRWTAELEPIDHDGRVNSWGTGDGTRRLSVTRPGRYTLKLGGFEESYRSVPDQEVEIPAAGVLEHEVQLEPR